MALLVLDSPSIGDMETAKIAAIFGIFIVSLFAVSFPGISKHSSFLRIPHVAFFIGKHFGTGVILSTAFCHLLQDSFEHLQHPSVKQQYPGVGKQTGLIILSSLLLIFLVEYISTSYVDFLQEEPSVPSSLAASLPPSRPRSPSTSGLEPVETTSLLSHVKCRSRSSTGALPYVAAFLGSDRHYRTLSRYDGRLLSVCLTTANQDAVSLFHDEFHDDEEAEAAQDREVPTIGRRRQVIGIIVLEMGILLHSFVIGLTLALTTGGDFASLLTAVVFHQLFEGLSLGIRISSLPTPDGHRRDWFAITLFILFALTTPVGLAIGVFVVAKSARALSSTLLLKGLMSAVSAGMLIYAATVEMIAADFIFGNLENGHGHGHGHSYQESAHDLEEESKGGEKTASAGRRALALGSLLGGVGSMVLVSLGE